MSILGLLIWLQLVVVLLMYHSRTVNSYFMNRLVASKSNSLQYSRFHPSPSVSNRVVMHAQTAGVANSFTSFMVQKNQLILDYLTNPNVANLTASVWEYVNFCDDSFDAFLNKSLDAAKTADKFQVLFNIRNELLFARQRKLQDAERILHSVLSAGGLKQMESRLAHYLRKNEIEMAFTVLLQMNIEDAAESEAEEAVQILTHLRTKIQEYQDATVSPPVRLLRLLIRSDEPAIRKQLLKQKLILTTEQRERYERGIVIDATKEWGGADVTVKDLQDTIEDILAQVS
jgi:hypothetical protein